MKWFVYLFSLYLLVLSGFTCNAADECCKDDFKTKTSTDHKENEDHKPVSLCIPFFACGACHSVIAPEITFEFVPTFVLGKKLQFFYLQPSFTASVCSIWQPPQIS